MPGALPPFEAMLRKVSPRTDGGVVDVQRGGRGGAKVCWLRDVDGVPETSNAVLAPVLRTTPPLKVTVALPLLLR
jgi:hypothetical protein